MSVVSPPPTVAQIFPTTETAPGGGQDRLGTTMACLAAQQFHPAPAGANLDKDTVIAGRVVDDSGRTVAGASVRLLDDSHESTAEVTATASGHFRFYAAPGTWTVRALSNAGEGDVTVAPAGTGLLRVDVKVA